MKDLVKIHRVHRLTSLTTSKNPKFLNIKCMYNSTHPSPPKHKEIRNYQTIDRHHYKKNIQRKGKKGGVPKKKAIYK
jgi:hypothetical protein